MIHRTFDSELDCPWMTIDVQITYLLHEEMGLVEVDQIMAHGYDVTAWFNHDYILDLIQDDMEERA